MIKLHIVTRKKNRGEETESFSLIRKASAFARTFLSSLYAEKSLCLIMTLINNKWGESE